MPWAGFKSTIPAIKPPQAYALDRTVTVGGSAACFVNRVLLSVRFLIKAFRPNDVLSSRDLSCRSVLCRGERTQQLVKLFSYFTWFTCGIRCVLRQGTTMMSCIYARTLCVPHLKHRGLYSVLSSWKIKKFLQDLRHRDEYWISWSFTVVACLLTQHYVIWIDRKLRSVMRRCAKTFIEGHPRKIRQKY